MFGQVACAPKTGAVSFSAIYEKKQLIEAGPASATGCLTRTSTSEKQGMDGCKVAWMHGCMDAWMRGCMDAWMDGWMDGWMGGWMDGWVDGWMDGWMDGCMDGWMDRVGLVLS